jgi:hypothetical protein
MPSYGVGVTLQYTAWNTSTNAAQTGDASNHTLRWIKDGTEDTSTFPTATEIDATNCPGVYKATITAAQCQCQCGTLAGKSGTANVSIVPMTVTFENLPTAAPSAAGGLPTIGTGTGQISLASGAVTAGTVSDKSGYSLATAPPTAAQIAAVILATPANLLATDNSGRVLLQPTQTGVTIPTVTSVGSVTGSVGSVTGNLGGNVAGAVGSVSGLTTTTIAAAILKTPANLLATDSSGNVLISGTQAVPMTGNTGNTVFDCLNAARAQGFGKWALSGTSLTLYGSDGSTVVRAFTLDSPTAPTQRS